MLIIYTMQYYLQSSRNAKLVIIIFFSVSKTCFLDHYLTPYKTEHNYFLVLIFHTSNLSMYSTCLGHTYTVFNKVNYDYYRLTIILVLNGKHSYLFINVLSLQQFWQIYKASKDNFVHQVWLNTCTECTIQIP